MIYNCCRQQFDQFLKYLFLKNQFGSMDRIEKQTVCSPYKRKTLARFIALMKFSDSHKDLKCNQSNQ